MLKEAPVLAQALKAATHGTRRAACCRVTPASDVSTHHGAGKTCPSWLQEAAEGVKIDLTRDEWYQLFNASRGASVP